MANWWDSIGTQMGDSLIGMQMPFGMAPPTDPQQRAAMINPMLMQMGASMLAGAKRQNPAVNLGNAVMAAQQFGSENMGRNLYAAQIAQSMEDRKTRREEDNRTRLWAKSQPWAAQYPVDQMSTEDIFKIAVGANKPPEHSGAYTQYLEAQSDPKFAQFLQQDKGGKPNIQIRSLNGRDVAVNMDTQEIVKDYGPSETRQQTVPQAVQGDAIRTEQAYGNLNAALDRYEKLATSSGAWAATVSGPTKDAIDQERRNIQLQAKELYNLGVLNGPDLQLMDQMIFDPGMSATSPIDAANKMMGGGPDRARASIARFREILKSVRDNKLAVVKSYGGTNGGQQGSVQPPADVDPALWQAMTPEEQALWQTSQ